MKLTVGIYLLIHFKLVSIGYWAKVMECGEEFRYREGHTTSSPEFFFGLKMVYSCTFLMFMRYRDCING